MPNPPFGQFIDLQHSNEMQSIERYHAVSSNNLSTGAASPLQGSASRQHPLLRKKNKRIIVVGPNGGGVRKTKTALLLGSIAEAAGITVLYICADSVLGSLSTSLSVGGAHHVEFFPDEEVLGYSGMLLAAADAVDADVVIIDLGANKFDDPAARRTLGTALGKLREDGHATYAVVSLIPGKTNLSADAMNFARRLEKVAEILLIYHGREEGGNFKLIDQLQHSYCHAEAQNDYPAALDLVTTAGITHFNWCKAPPPGFKRAGASIAANLFRLATQSAVEEMLGSHGAAETLRPLAEGYLEHLYQGRSSIWEIHDLVLESANEQLLALLALTELTDASDDKSINVTARAFISAMARSALAETIARKAVAACQIPPTGS